MLSHHQVASPDFPLLLSAAALAGAAAKAQWAASVKETAHCVSCAVRDSNPGPAD